jgi:signal transduction histidine kinase
MDSETSVSKPMCQTALSSLSSKIAAARDALERVTARFGDDPLLQELDASLAAAAGLAAEALASAEYTPGDPGSGPDPMAMRSVLSKERQSRRLARSIEGALGQLLANAAMEIDYSVGLIESDPESLRRGMADLKAELSQGLRTTRRLVADLRPPQLLGELGLGPSLARYAQALSGEAGLSIDTDGLDSFTRRLPPSLELAVYRTVQEALKNTCQHAGATRATIRVTAGSERIVWTVEDNGRGFDVLEPGRGGGLLEMRERARAVGAQIEVWSRSGSGTRVVLSVPDPSAPPADRLGPGMDKG